jgi:hypothetical protein
MGRRARTEAPHAHVACAVTASQVTPVRRGSEGARASQLFRAIDAAGWSFQINDVVHYDGTTHVTSTFLLRPQ